VIFSKTKNNCLVINLRNPVMNHIYRSIWSQALGSWIAVSEHAKSKSKRSGTRQKLLVTGLLFCWANGWALPTGEQPVAGQVNINTPNAGQMQINQTSQQAIVNWQSFSIAPNESVNIQQPNSQAALLNRVVGQDASQIQGQLNANGQVYLVNPNGVMFGKTAQVDVGGLIASTHNITDSDFLNGINHFTQNGSTARIDNQGTIKTPDGGVVAFIGNQVSNNGTINTPKGTTALAAGKTVDLDFQGNGLVEVKVSEAALNAQITNKGAIQADGGRVVMSAKAANSLLDTVINQEGIVTARSMVQRNGEIILDGGDNGTVKVSGTLDTSSNQGLNATTGGNINVTGQQIAIQNSAMVNASGNTGGGTIKVFANMDSGTINVAGKLDASAPKNGDGGFVETSAAHVNVADTAKISTKAANGKTGTWLIDPNDYTISASGGNITGTFLSSTLALNNVTISTATQGTAGGNGDIFVNDTVSWSANLLTLNAERNININANLNGSGRANLALQYGQANVGGDYFISNGAKVNLPAGLNFSTQSGSTGTVKNFTVITSLGLQGSITGTDLQGMNGNLAGLYALGADIDASVTSTWNSGEGFMPVGDITTKFTSSFDGLGHTITGLTINRPTTSNVGLFGYTTNAAISNVGMVGGIINGYSQVGGLVGNNVNTPIFNAYTTGDVNATANYAGGLVGYNQYGTINNAYATGKISADSLVGGLIAGNDRASIYNVYATGNVSATNLTQEGYAGGLVGFNVNGSSINFAYATGLVSGIGPRVGGLVGLNGNSSTSAGGTASTSNSFWNTQTTNQSNGIGFNGLVGSSSNVSGKTTTEMQQMATFSNAGWNIANTGGGTEVWRIYDGFTAPLLHSFLVPLTVTATISETYNGLIHNSLANASYSVAGAANSGHFFSTANPFGNPVNVGSYTLTGTLFSDQQGYDISFLGGALTITPAALSIAANNISKTYGQTLNFTGTEFISSGLQNSETIGSVDLSSNGVIETAGVTARPYTITASNATGGTFNANNYSISYSNGALTVNPAALSITANNASKTYGQTLSFAGTEFISSGLRNSETIGLVALNSNGANATAGVIASPYAITASNATGGTFNANNYSITYNSGALTVKPAQLIIQANDDYANSSSLALYEGLAYQGGNGVSYAGFVNNESSQNLTGSLAYTGDSQGAKNSGHYLITPAGYHSDNYQISYLDGILNIDIASSPSAPASTPASVFDPAATVNPVPVTVPKTTDDASAVTSEQSVNEVSDDFTNNESNNDFTFSNILSDEPRQFIPALSVKNSAGQVKRLQLSSDKKFLSLLLEDGSVRVWDFERGVQRSIVSGDKHQDLSDISSVNDKGEIITVASKAGIGAYNIIGSLLNDKLAVNAPNINYFASSNDGSLLLVSTGDALSLWDNNQNQARWQSPQLRGKVNNMVLSDNKHYAAVLSHQEGVYIYDPKAKLKSPTDALDIIDLETGKTFKSLPNFGEDVVYTRFKNNDTLSIGLANGQLIDWSINTDKSQTIVSFAENIRKVDHEQQTYAYIAENNAVRISNPQGEVRLSIQNQGNPITEAKLLAGGKNLLTVLANGDLALWDVASGKKILRLFSTQQGWTVMDSFGRFDGSDEAIENFNWIADAEPIPLDSFSENYYEPGLLTSVLQNQDYLNRSPDVINEGINLPPKVEIQLAEQQKQSDKVQVQLDIYNRGGGINKIQIFQNGKLINDESNFATEQNQKENNSDHKSLTLDLTPVSGENTLKVIATNDMGIENSSSEISFDGKSKAYNSATRLMTVGINQYSDSDINLKYSVADAELIATTIKNNSNLIASKALIDEKATKPQILAELKELSQGAQQDVLVIYFAGHGMALGKEWYFLPYETKLEPTPEQIAKQGVTGTELSDIFKNSKIQHILLMVDACYSGAGLDAFSKLENGQRYLSRQLSRSLGITVIAAAAKDQEATELASLGHGLFTYLIADEIEKKKANNAITAHSIADNIAKTLPQFSKELLGASQDPAVYTKGNDFMLTNFVKNKK
jgi:filamentous hemagglutinin family protein